MKLGKKMTMTTLAAAISLGGLGLVATGCAGGAKSVKAEEKSCGGSSCSGKTDAAAEKSCGGKADTATEAGGEAGAAADGEEKSCGAGSCGEGSCG